MSRQHEIPDMSRGKEKVIHAHFSAEGLVTAAMDALQAFNVEVLNTAVKNKLQKHPGVLASTLSLVSTRILNSSSRLNGHFDRSEVPCIYTALAWDAVTICSIHMELTGECDTRRKYHNDSLESYQTLLNYITQHGDKSLSLNLTKEAVHTRLIDSINDSLRCVFDNSGVVGTNLIVHSTHNEYKPTNRPHYLWGHTINSETPIPLPHQPDAPKLQYNSNLSVSQCISGPLCFPQVRTVN